MSTRLCAPVCSGNQKNSMESDTLQSGHPGSEHLYPTPDKKVHTLPDTVYN